MKYGRKERGQGKSPNQGLTNANDLPTELLEGRESPLT